MKTKIVKAEFNKMNTLFLILVVISIVTSVGVMNLIYFYDHKIIDTSVNIMKDYIQVQCFLSAQLKLIMPLVVIIFSAYVWTIDLEGACVIYNFLAIGRQKFLAMKVAVCIGIAFFLYALLAAGLGLFYQLILRDSVLISKCYVESAGFIIIGSFSLIVWILIIGIIALRTREFGKTVAIGIMFFFTFYILSSYFPKYLYLMPSSAVITIWGYGITRMVIKNIVNVMCYTALFSIVLIKIIKKKEV